MYWPARFKAKFGNSEILPALLSIARGQGRVWGCRLWECEAIVRLGWSETAWSRLSLEERARKVCAIKLPEWLSSLETERELARLRAKG